jgi:hypothetical protein
MGQLKTSGPNEGTYPSTAFVPMTVLGSLKDLCIHVKIPLPSRRLYQEHPLCGLSGGDPRVGEIRQHHTSF